MLYPGRWRSTGVIFVLAAWLAGCSGTAKLPLSGTVLVDGKPVDRGVLSFRSPSGGPTTGGGIEDGKFAMPAEHGLTPGDYQVTVQAMRRTGKQIRDPQRGMVEEFLPIKLSRPEHSVTISADNSQNLALDLASQR